MENRLILVPNDEDSRVAIKCFAMVDKIPN